MNTMSAIPGFLTRIEAAEKIGISPEMVSVYCKRGRLPHKRWGKSLMIPEDAVQAFERDPVGNPNFGKKTLRKKRK